jgi:hypothetical protein
MKNFLISLLLILTTVSPVQAQDLKPIEIAKKPYIAVFCNKEFLHDWVGKTQLKMLYVTDTWEAFDDFLQRVRQDAGDQEVVIDIAVHGTPGALLAITRETEIPGVEVVEQATWGYIVNHIERYLDTSKLTVLTEACYAGHTYKSIRGNDLSKYRKYREDCNHVPQFHIYGSTTDCISVDTLVYSEYIAKIPMFMLDLRGCETGFKPHYYSEKVQLDQCERMQELIFLIDKHYSL